MAWIIHRQGDRQKKNGEDSLMHYGIPGQVHGVRRYQYEDGSYTPEGLRRLHEKYKERAAKKAEASKNLAEKRARQNTVDLTSKLTSTLSESERRKQAVIDKMFADGFLAEMDKNPEGYTLVRVGDKYLYGGDLEGISNWVINSLEEISGDLNKDFEAIGVYDNGVYKYQKDGSFMPDTYYALLENKKKRKKSTE